MFENHSAFGTPTPQTTRRRPFADITNSKLKKTKTQTGGRRAKKTKWTSDYAETYGTYQMHESDDEEVKPTITRRDSFEGRSNGRDASAFGGVLLAARPAVIDQTEIPATSDDVKPKGKGAAARNASNAISSSLIVTLRMSPRKLAVKLSLPPPAPRLVDHPVLRLEDLIGELEENEAYQAQQIFAFIRKNLEEGRDGSDLARYVIRLFEPVKQRLSNDVTQAEQKIKLLDDVDRALDGMDIDG